MRLAPQDSISGFKVSLQQAVQFFGNSRQQSADFQAHSARFLLKAQALFCSHLKRGFPVHLHDLAQLSFQESVISWRRVVRKGFPLQRVQLLLHSSQSPILALDAGKLST